MKYFGKAFIISTVFTLAAMVCCFLGYFVVSSILCTLAFFANATEIKGYGTFFQFTNFRVHTLLLGFSVDQIYGGENYLYTASMFALSFAGVLRLELFNLFTLGKYYGVEILGLIFSYGFFVYAGLSHPGDWHGWVLPALTLLFMTYIGANVIVSAIKVQKVKQPVTGGSVGQKAPDFKLPDHEGNSVSLSSFEGKNHVLLVFMRGDWCPTCHIMIRAYEKNRDKFLEKEIVAIGIGPDTTEVNKKMIERLGWKNILLSDHTQQTTKTYGLSFMENNSETKYPEGSPLPASFLIDKSGIIRHVSHPHNAGEFLSPMTVFPVIEALA
jgi:peroxiredoxin